MTPQRLTLFQDIITGTLHSKLINTPAGQQVVVKSYNHEMRLNIGDYVVVYGIPPHQRHMYCGTIAQFNGKRFNLADDAGFVFSSCCAEGARCIVKY